MKSPTHQLFLKNYALHDKHYTAEDAPLAHPKATPKSLISALDVGGRDDEDIRRDVLEHPATTSDVLDHIFYNASDSWKAPDEEQEIRAAAMRHPKASKGLLMRGLFDEDDDVREAAENHPKTTPAMLKKAEDGVFE